MIFKPNERQKQIRSAVFDAKGFSYTEIVNKSLMHCACWRYFFLHFFIFILLLKTNR